MEFILAIAVVLLGVMLVDVRGRLARIERKQGLKKEVSGEPSSSSNAEGHSAPQVSPRKDSQQTEPTKTWTPQSSDVSDRFLAWAKEDWLLKLGILLLLIGLGWFVSYAFANNWIGPMGRVAIGIIAGIVIAAFGWYWVGRARHQGALFLVLGSTTILLTLFAAREVYDFFAPASALGMMAAAAAIPAAASIRFEVRWLALAGLVFAGLAPILVDASEPNVLGLMSYLFIVVLVSLAIVIFRGFRELILASVVLVAGYSVSFLPTASASELDLILGFVAALTALFALAALAGIWRQKAQNMVTFDLVAGLIVSGLLLLLWIFVAMDDFQAGIAALLAMAFFALVGLECWQWLLQKNLAWIYGGISAGFLAAATAAFCEGEALAIAYIIEAAAVPVVIYQLSKDEEKTRASALVLLAPLLLVFESMAASSWDAGMFHADFFVILVFALTLFGLGWYFRGSLADTHFAKISSGEGLFSGAFFVAGSIFAYILVWLSLHAVLVNFGVATMLSLGIYTIVGLGAYVVGTLQSREVLRVYGASLAGFVVGRLLLIDLWQMETPERVVTLLVIGLLLASTAFLPKGGRPK